MFHIYIHNRAGSSATEVVANAASILQNWFNEICNGTSYASATAHTTVSAASVGNNELLAYVLSSQGNSIFRTLYPGIELGQTGSTGLTSSGMLSEVYYDQLEGDANKPRLLAAIIFHELMHNKLDANPDAMTVSDIHTGGGSGLANVPVSNSSTMTDRNKQLMRQTLSKRERQYTAGIR